MGKWSNLGGKFSGGEFHRGGNFEKKMKTYKMRLQNKPIYEISSKSDNRKVVKFRGKSMTKNVRDKGGDETVLDVKWALFESS